MALRVNAGVPVLIEAVEGGLSPGPPPPAVSSLVRIMMDPPGTTRLQLQQHGPALLDDRPFASDMTSYSYQNRTRSGLFLAQPRIPLLERTE